VPGFLKSAGIVHGEHDFFDAIYVYAWFTGLAIGGLVYWIGARFKSVRR
jgi:cytosine/uracil/thiamine/allantoin permease